MKINKMLSQINNKINNYKNMKNMIKLKKVIINNLIIYSKMMNFLKYKILNKVTMQLHKLIKVKFNKIFNNNFWFNN